MGEATENTKDLNARIDEYYRSGHFFYRFFWMNKRNLAMHFGFWDKSTKNLNDALINENKIIAEKLCIEKTDKVLDAGCGVGGTAIWVAENYGANVVGITITGRQVELAKKYAKGRSVDGLVDFKQGDFCDTKFPSESFDKIYAIESVCHAEDKADFLREAYRLLKTGGKIIISDGYLINEELNESQKRIYDDLCRGWVLPNLSTKKYFSDSMQKIGFKNVEFQDLTDKVLKSSKEMHDSAKFIYPVVSFLSKLALISKTVARAEKACLAQYPVFNDKVGVYGIFTGEK